MLRNALHLIVFFLGLAAAVWIGAGYIGHNAIGATVALLVAACYCVGGLELLHFRRATASLERASRDVARAGDDLGGWVQQLPAALQGPVRLRVEGNRVALPGPTLTPYLVGLLVLLGMLGTLLGMMATLRGTGLALQSATDLQAIRGSLASPVEGLAVAFGTSIAGVATSAMLGLLSALLRRERLVALQALDAAVSRELPQQGHAWQRAERLRLMQDQSALLPTVVQQLQALADSVQRGAADSHAQLQARQAEFIARHEAAQDRMTLQLEQALQRGVHSGTEAIGATLQPLLRDTLERLDTTTARTQAAVVDAVKQQLQVIQAAADSAAVDLRAQLAAALEAQQNGNRALVASVADAMSVAVAEQQEGAGKLLQDIDARMRDQQAHVASQWNRVTEQQAAAHQAAAEQSAATLASALAGQQDSARQLLEGVRHAQEQQRDLLADADGARLQQWSHAFSAIAEQAGRQWALQNDEATAQYQRITEALQQAASVIGDEARQQSSALLVEIRQLLDSASEAPRAAAEMAAELRQRLSDSLAHDTQTLEERAGLLGTVSSLMDALQAAAADQKVAVDALIENAAGLMERSGDRFAGQVEAQADTLQKILTGVAEAAAGSRELASGLEQAVSAFGSTSTTLSTHLEQLAGALDASLARSDEQLAYYVAQAREVVELSLMSQQQITEELRQLGSGRHAAGTA